MRGIALLLAAAVILAVFAPAASACINDREVVATEKEFKSSYIDQQVPAPAPEYNKEPEPAPDNKLWVLGGSGLGIALLGGALVLGYMRPKSTV